MRLLKKFTLWTITGIVISTLTFGQKTKEISEAPPTLTKREIKREKLNHDCKAVDKFSPSQRLEFYPFNTASEVRLVSFDNKPDSSFEHRIPETNGEVDLSRLKELKTLNKEQFDSLTYLLFNVGYRGKISTLEGTGCYNPRNAILFINSNGKAFEFIELCFECSGLRLSSDKIKTGEFCNQKYELLKSFFIQRGIKIGTAKEIE